jgi:hypothetical protein
MINEEISYKLNFLATQLGGMAFVEIIPASVLEKIVMHQDDTIAIGPGMPNIELYEPDLEYGYKVYNKDYKFIYSVNSSSGLITNTWGLDKKDIIFTQSLDFGDYAYLRYKVRGRITEIPITDFNGNYLKDEEGNISFISSEEDAIYRNILLVRV